eukprot:TRINITY_DN10672_c0_g1_i1.p1 TRINITY_DN10672_c0_g1~~TRINITY_DN10672_c0_g1_i1.p1  ORF type:complete len:419 (-),score=99.60 TRINITY_DN10672_c0_g1_i1:145-1335(-)
MAEAAGHEEALPRGQLQLLSNGCAAAGEHRGGALAALLESTGPHSSYSSAVSSALPSPGSSWMTSRPTTQDLALSSPARRDADAVEGRLVCKLARLRDELSTKLDKVERSFESSLERVEQRLSMQVDLQAKLDRKLAELRGGLTGLSEETRLQIKRMDAGEARFWEFKRELEDEIRTKMVDIVQEQQAALSKMRHTLGNHEDVAGKLDARSRRLEEAVADLNARGVDSTVKQAFGELHGRLEGLEALYRHLSTSDRGGSALPYGTPADELEDKVISMHKRGVDQDMALERLQDALHQYASELKEQQVVLGTVRAQVQRAEDLQQGLSEQVRREVDAKLQPALKELQEQGSRHSRQAEALDSLKQWAKAVDGALEDMITGDRPDELTQIIGEAPPQR